MCQDYNKSKVGRFLRHSVHCYYRSLIGSDNMAYQIVPFSIALSDFPGHWPSTNLFKCNISTRFQLLWCNVMVCFWYAQYATIVACVLTCTPADWQGGWKVGISVQMKRVCFQLERLWNSSLQSEAYYVRGLFQNHVYVHINQQLLGLLQSWR